MLKTVILCGGAGTRLAEETVVRPKPLVTIGSRPILWHIMNIYALHGFKNFVLALGYKGEMIKDYFLNYRTLSSDFYVDLGTNSIEQKPREQSEDWKIHLIDTGAQSMTGGRLWRLRDQLRGSGTFFLTYGDGVANVDLTALLDFHKRHGKLATVTAVRPTARFGALSIENDHVTSFREKVQSSEGWINGGFFVFEPGIFEYLDGESNVLEAAPLENLARDKQLIAYRHPGFWQCMDTVRDRELLEDVWKKGAAPWSTLSQ